MASIHVATFSEGDCDSEHIVEIVLGSHIERKSCTHARLQVLSQLSGRDRSLGTKTMHYNSPQKSKNTLVSQAYLSVYIVEISIVEEH